MTPGNPNVRRERDLFRHANHLAGAALGLAFGSASLAGLIFEPARYFDGDVGRSLQELFGPGLPGAFFWAPVLFILAILCSWLVARRVAAARTARLLWAVHSVSLGWALGAIAGLIPATLLTVRLGRIIPGYVDGIRFESTILELLNLSLLVALALAATTAGAGVLVRYFKMKSAGNAGSPDRQVSVDR